MSFVKKEDAGDTSGAVGRPIAEAPVVDMEAAGGSMVESSAGSSGVGIMK